VATLLLIRHCSTPETGRVLSGRLPDRHLSATGLSEAEALARRLASVRLAAVFSSPLERARQTAEPIAAAQRAKRSVIEHAGLLEVDYGAWSGRTLRSLHRLQSWRRLLAHPSRGRFPGGETLFDAQVRAAAACEEMAARFRRQAVALVTHADIIKLTVGHYLGQPLDLFNRLAVAPGSVTILDLAPQSPPRLLLLNHQGALPSWA
jgi:broad specificity phosphatase PhoE